MGSTINACTKGIYTWGKPIKVKSKSGEDITVILIDTEGLGSFDQDKTHDAKIFSLSILLSSYFVYNSMGTIDEVALDNLSFVINLTKHIQVTSSASSKQAPEEEESQLSSFMPKFLWLVRDFTLQLVDPQQNPITEKQYLEQALSFKSNINSKNEIRKYITSFFPERDCVVLPRPAVEEGDLHRLDSIPYASLRQTFRQKMDSLKEKIFREVKLKTLHGNAINGSGLVGMVQCYVSALNEGAVPSIESAWSNVSHIQSKKAVEVALKHYFELFNKSVQSTLVEEEKLNEVHSSATVSALQIFSSSAMGDSSVISKHRKELEEKLEKEIDNIRTKCSHASLQMCKSLLDKLYAPLEKKVADNKLESTHQLCEEWKLFQREYLSQAVGSQKWTLLCEFLSLKMGDTLARLSSFQAEKLKRSLEGEVQKCKKELFEEKERFHNERMSWDKEKGEIKAQAKQEVNEAKEEAREMKMEKVKMEKEMEERKKEMEKQLEEHKKNAQQSSSLLKSALEKMEMEMKEKEAQFKQNILSLDAKLESSEKKIHSLSSLLQAAKEEILSKSSSIEKMSKEVSEKDSALKKTSTEKNEEVSKLQQLMEKERKQFQVLEGEKKRVESVCAQLESQLKQLESEKKQANLKIESLVQLQESSKREGNKHMEEVEKQLESQLKQLRESEAILKQERLKSEKLQKQVQTMQEERSKLESNSHKNEREREDKISNLESKSKELEKKLEESQNKVEKLSSCLKEKEASLKQKETLEAKAEKEREAFISSKEKDVREIVSQKEKLEKVNGRLREELEKVGQEKNNSEKVVSTLEEEIFSLRNQLGQKKQLQNEAQQELNNLRQLQKSFEEKEGKLSSSLQKMENDNQLLQQTVHSLQQERHTLCNSIKALEIQLKQEKRVDNSNNNNTSNTSNNRNNNSNTNSVSGAGKRVNANLSSDQITEAAEGDLSNAPLDLGDMSEFSEVASEEGNAAKAKKKKSSKRKENEEEESSKKTNKKAKMNAKHNEQDGNKEKKKSAPTNIAKEADYKKMTIPQLKQALAKNHSSVLPLKNAKKAVYVELYEKYILNK